MADLDQGSSGVDALSCATEGLCCSCGRIYGRTDIGPLGRRSDGPSSPSDPRPNGIIYLPPLPLPEVEKRDKNRPLSPRTSYVYQPRIPITPSGPELALQPDRAYPALTGPEDHHPLFAPTYEIDYFVPMPKSDLRFPPPGLLSEVQQWLGTCVWGAVFNDYTVFGMESQVSFQYEDGTLAYSEKHQSKGVQIAPGLYLLKSGSATVCRLCVGIVMRYADGRRMQGLNVTFDGLYQAMDTDAEYKRLAGLAQRTPRPVNFPSPFSAVLLFVEVGVEVRKVTATLSGFNSDPSWNRGSGSGYNLAEYYLGPHVLNPDTSFLQTIQAMHQGFSLAAKHDRLSGGELRSFFHFHDPARRSVEQVIKLPKYIGPPPPKFKRPLSRPPKLHQPVNPQFHHLPFPPPFRPTAQVHHPPPPPQLPHQLRQLVPPQFHHLPFPSQFRPTSPPPLPFPPPFRPTSPTVLSSTTSTPTTTASSPTVSASTSPSASTATVLI